MLFEASKAVVSAMNGEVKFQRRHSVQPGDDGPEEEDRTVQVYAAPDGTVRRRSAVKPETESLYESVSCYRDVHKHGASTSSDPIRYKLANSAAPRIGLDISLCRGRPIPVQPKPQLSGDQSPHGPKTKTVSQPLLIMRKRRKKHVEMACVPCKKAHLACDESRPCTRCIDTNRADNCVDDVRPKAHVSSACVNCKTGHVGCDTTRPCQRCLLKGKARSCIDTEQRKRGRPRLRHVKDASRKRRELRLRTVQPISSLLTEQPTIRTAVTDNQDKRIDIIGFAGTPQRITNSAGVVGRPALTAHGVSSSVHLSTFLTSAATVTATATTSLASSTFSSNSTTLSSSSSISSASEEPGSSEKGETGVPFSKIPLLPCHSGLSECLRFANQQESPVAFIFLHPNMTCIRATVGITECTGYSPYQIQGRSILEFLGPGENLRFMRMCADLRVDWHSHLIGNKEVWDLVQSSHTAELLALPIDPHPQDAQINICMADRLYRAVNVVLSSVSYSGFLILTILGFPSDKLYFGAPNTHYSRPQPAHRTLSSVDDKYGGDKDRIFGRSVQIQKLPSLRELGMIQ